MKFAPIPAPCMFRFKGLLIKTFFLNIYFVTFIGLECFEGMKAYKSLVADPSTGNKPIRLFRPDCNMKRLSDSMHRLHFECYDFDKTELTKCIKDLVRVDQDWIPEGEGYSLYIRPIVIATNPFL